MQSLMRIGKTGIVREWLKRCLVALFAFGQILPSGVALAADANGELYIIICTAEGEQEVAWSDFSGEEDPFGEHGAPAEADGAPCHACVSSCRNIATREAEPQWFANAQSTDRAARLLSAQSQRPIAPEPIRFFSRAPPAGP